MVSKAVYLVMESDYYLGWVIQPDVRGDRMKYWVHPNVDGDGPSPIYVDSLDEAYAYIDEMVYQDADSD